MYELLGKLYYKDTENYNKTYKDRVNNLICIKLGLDINGNEAFFLQTAELFEKIISIIKYNTDIMHLMNILPNIAIEQYAWRCLIDEVILTNNIEGVHSTRKEINDILTKPENSRKKNKFFGLVRRYNMLCKESICFESCNDIRKLYDELVLPEISLSDKDNIPDGEIFRKSGVNIHSVTDKIIHKGITPESKIQEYMSKALCILNNEKINIFFRIAIFHYLFGYIHPFYDGNGRTSRFISSYFLSNELNHNLIGYRLSYTIRENINKYYKAFKICNDEKNRGDLTPFLIMFFDILEESMYNLKEALETRNNQKCMYENKIDLLPHSNEKNYKEIYSILISAELFSEKGVSLDDLLKCVGVSRTTITQKLKRIPNELINIKEENKLKFYSLNLKYMDELINNNAKTDRE